MTVTESSISFYRAMARKVRWLSIAILEMARFEDVTQAAGIDPVLREIGCTAGDYDNDGVPTSR